MASESIVGTSAERLDADAKVSGDHAYPSDIHIPVALWVEVVRAGVSHARILGVDISAASRYPGVVGIYTAADIVGSNAFGLIVHDQPVIARDVVRFSGDVLAVVAGETEEAARRGAGLVRVALEALPEVVDPILAIQPGSPSLHPGGNICAELDFQSPDWDGSAAERSAYVIEYDYRTGRQAHAFLETEAGSSWIAEDGRLTVAAGGQNPFMDQRQISAALGIPIDRIRVLNPMMGGAFGGKEDISVQIFLALVTLKTGRPARMMLRREESLAYGVKRHPFLVNMKAGVDRAGMFTFLDVDMLADTGAYTTLGPAVIGLAAEHCSGPYYFPASRVAVKAVYTTNGNSSAFRGFGNPQVTTGIEQVVDLLAKASGLDPMLLRAQNCLKAGDRGVINQRINYGIPLPGLLGAANEGRLLNGGENWKAAAVYGRRRGVGVAACWQGFGLGPGAEPGATVEVGLSDRGRYCVAVGCPDMGEGNLTAFAQIACRALGCRLDEVEIRAADTDGPDSHSSNSSRTVTVVGNAVALACSKLVQQILGVLRGQLEAAVEHSNKGFEVGGAVMPLERLVEATGPQKAQQYHMPVLPPASAEGIPHLSYTPAVLVVGLEVNLLTGEIDPLQIEVYVDPGTVINPAGVEAQIEGAVAQGLGFAMMEDALVKDGIVRNHRFSNYIIPSIRDVPYELMTVILTTPEPTNSLGVRGVAEIGITPVAAAIGNAIADAVGVRLHSFPVSPEALLDAMEKNNGEIKPS